MTLLETIYSELRQAGLVENAEDFSINYLGRSKHWYAFQKHAGRDFSVGAAIHCLRCIRAEQRSSARSKAQKVALRGVEAQVAAHLNTQHCVADVC
jgi:hypothetical protein